MSQKISGLVVSMSDESPLRFQLECKELVLENKFATFMRFNHSKYDIKSIKKHSNTN